MFFLNAIIVPQDCPEKKLFELFFDKYLWDLDYY